MQDIPKTFHPGLLIGYEHSDDAAVIKLSDDIAAIQTLDFFPSMVSDPLLFGRIAAANALSDVYAMGGEPVCALNIVAFPEKENFEILKKILIGGAEKVREAGAALVGGHTINDSQPKYGLSVMGTVHPKKIWANCSTQPGDVLFLTKRLGIGIVMGAYNVGEMDKRSFDEAVAQMTLLNKYAAEVLHELPVIDGNEPVHACTDVTGFGLLGHLSEMIDETKTVRLKRDAIPFIKASYGAAKEFLVTGGGQNNRNFLNGKVRFDFDDYAFEEILFDPQTSGGLIFSVGRELANTVKSLFAEKNVTVWEIGKIENFAGCSIIVEN